MKKNQKALVRRTTIFSRLNAGEQVNVKALAEEFGVTRRTIQDDLNKQLKSTYDIVDLGHGNYAFAEGYRLRTAEDEEEKIAVSLMKSLQRSAVPDLNEYIDAALPMVKNYEEMFLFDLNFEPIKDMGIFKVILQTIRWKTALEFVYTNREGETKEVTVHPYRIANFKNYWYLIAYDLVDEKIKSYYMGSIEKLRTLFENFIPDEVTQKELDTLCAKIDSPWYNGGEKSVILKLSNDAQTYLNRQPLQHMEIVENNDEATIVRLSYSDDTEVLSLVKKWLPDIEIVGDDDLSDKLDADIETYLKRK